MQQFSDAALLLANCSESAHAPEGADMPRLQSSMALNSSNGATSAGSRVPRSLHRGSVSDMSLWSLSEPADLFAPRSAATDSDAAGMSDGAQPAAAASDVADLLSSSSTGSSVHQASQCASVEISSADIASEVHFCLNLTFGQAHLDRQL